jgi:hypothetical protein
MNLNDFIIIYLACGAPFGVYYFFDKKYSLPTNRLWFESILIFLFWIPFGFKVLVKNKKNSKSLISDFDKSPTSDSEPDKYIFSIQKEIEKIILKSNVELSIYEFREVTERYIGLTFAKQNAESITVSENMTSEFFKISESPDLNLSSICFNRRNRNRLSFHQKNARRDFIDILDKVLLTNCEKKSLGFLACEFVKLLNDSEAKNTLSKMFDDYPQTEKKLIVKNTEIELWKPEKHKPLPASQLSIQFQTLSATANLRKKD